VLSADIEVGVVMNVIDLPLCLRNFFGNLFLPIFAASIEAISAFRIPYGNDVHLPNVFGKGRLYIVPKGYSCILELVWWYGAQGFAYVRKSAVEQCVGITGHSFIPGGKKH